MTSACGHLFTYATESYSLESQRLEAIAYTSDGVAQGVLAIELAADAVVA